MQKDPVSEVFAEIISTGNEVLGGRIVDTNAVYLSRHLMEIGIPPAYRTTVGDDEKRYEEVLRTALSRANVVITTGGLGPTEDDLTREVCAKVLGRDLLINPEAKVHIRSILDKYGIHCNGTEMVQAVFPDGTGIIPNRHGTAYGFTARTKKGLLAALSGVPSELEQMAQEHLFPYLKEVFPGLKPSESRLLHVFGLSESALQKIVMPVFKKFPEITWGITASQMVLTVSLSIAPGLEEKLSSSQREISEALGDKLFAVDGQSLQKTVSDLLNKYDLTIAFAESCTGGLVSHLLTEVPGILSHLLESAVTYSNESKVRRLGVREETLAAHGAVSEQVAEEMSRGMRESSGADIGVATTGIAGPSGATPEKPVGLVYISVATKNDVWTREFRFTGTRSDIKKRAANTALNMTRLSTALTRFETSLGLRKLVIRPRKEEELDK